VVQGLGLNYTPKPNFVGSDSVTYAVVGVNGSFASTTIQISVVAAAPVFKDASLTVETGRSASIDLASLISGPMFNGVSIRLNSSPTHGVARISGTVLTYSSTAGYVGLDSLQLTATAIGGTSNPAQLLITVVPRPDPSKDPGVIAMFAANTAAVRHFEQTQIEHFDGRMLSLASQSANGKSTAGQNTVTECGPISYWVSGLNSAGRYRTMNGLKYSTFGLSAGGDRCFAGGQTHIGFGLGYARDHSESERDLSFMKASANTAASYLTTQLFPSMRFSFMIGVNQIQDRFARFDVHDQALAYGEWKGTQMISSGALSSDVSFGKVLLIPYLRLDLTKLQLDPFSESGGGAYLLHYHKQTMQSQRSTLGFNSEIKLATSWGELIPRLKLELQRDFARRDSLKINYVDMPDAVYLVPNNDLDRRVVLVSLGADMIWKNGIMAIFNFSHTNANAKNKSNRFNVRFSYQY
jgi:outer membrane autotransporter protein